MEVESEFDFGRGVGVPGCWELVKRERAPWSASFSQVSPGSMTAVSFGAGSGVRSGWVGDL